MGDRAVTCGQKEKQDKANGRLARLSEHAKKKEDTFKYRTSLTDLAICFKYRTSLTELAICFKYRTSLTDLTICFQIKV